MKFNLNGFTIDIPYSVIKSNLEQLRQDPEFVAARARSPKSIVNLSEFPLFHLVVESGKYTLVNKTGYDVNKDYMNKKGQLGYFKTYNDNNLREGGKAIKRVTVVTHANECSAGPDEFSNGWKPVQDKNKSKNNKRAYFVEFMDNTNTGWLGWYVRGYADDAVRDAGSVLYYLAGYSSSRSDVRAAVEQCVKTR
jgi:hypothetical protein